jgi:phenylpropionate dioxygenase-like ring-hydroxylating dioxygenase large terminal subunit
MDRNRTPPLFTSDRYSSPEFLDREKQTVFRNTWMVVARESDVGRAGEGLAFDELGEALLVLRGSDHRVRTFRNACQHRGTRLVAKKCNARQITCPYHGWTYGLDGRLIGVPKQAGFAGLKMDDHGLEEVRTECWAGFVWITFSADLPSVAEYLGTVVGHLEPYRLTDMRPIFKRTWALPCNWKAVLDQATESYHLAAVHPALHRAADPMLTFYAHGPHHMQTVDLPEHWLRDRLDRLTVPADLSFTANQLHMFHKYLVFPNMVLNVLPYHLTVFRVFPMTPDTCRFHYEFHLRRHAGVAGRIRGWLTLLASLYILREDFRLLAPFQSGVRSTRGRAVTFHQEEIALEHFHGVLDRYTSNR